MGHNWPIRARREPSRRQWPVWLLAGFAVIGLVLSMRRPQSTPMLINGKTCNQATLADRVAAADLIMTGSVFLVMPVMDGADVIIAPEKLYRGKLPSRGIRIAANVRPAGGGSGESEGNNELTFSSSQPPYLLFLHVRSDGRYDTQRCFGTRLLGDGLTTDEQRVLGTGRVVHE